MMEEQQPSERREDEANTSPSLPTRRIRRRLATHDAERNFKGGLIRYRSTTKQPRSTEDSEDDKGWSPLTPAEILQDVLASLANLGRRMLPKLGLRDFVSTSCWRAALIELVGNLQFTFLSCASVVAALAFKYDPPSQAIAILNIPLLALYIFACAAASGGHLNPLITFATVLTRLCTVSRGLMYISAQLVGAILGCLLLRAVIGEEAAAQSKLGGCSIGNPPNEMGQGRAFLSETIFSFAQLFICFGTVLDPRQGEIFGPVLSPFFVSITVAVFIFLSSAMFPGYSGAGMNPARCVAPSIALGDNLGHIWVYIVGPMTAAFILALLYNLVPPHHKTIYKEFREKRKNTRKLKRLASIRTQLQAEEDDEGALPSSSKDD